MLGVVEFVLLAPADDGTILRRSETNGSLSRNHRHSPAGEGFQTGLIEVAPEPGEHVDADALELRDMVWALKVYPDGKEIGAGRGPVRPLAVGAAPGERYVRVLRYARRLTPSGVPEPSDETREREEQGAPARARSASPRRGHARSIAAAEFTQHSPAS